MIRRLMANIGADPTVGAPSSDKVSAIKCAWAFLSGQNDGQVRHRHDNSKFARIERTVLFQSILQLGWCKVNTSQKFFALIRNLCVKP